MNKTAQPSPLTTQTTPPAPTVSTTAPLPTDDTDPGQDPPWT
jgi:hypothetical protein